MPTNGSGTYTVPPGSNAVSLATASSTAFNDLLTDLATALTDRINVDGTKAFEANQSFGGFKATSLASGTASTDAVNLGQVQNNIFNWADGGGTADAITATFTPTVTAYTNGMRLRVRATAANTATAPTFNADSVGAKKIFKGAGEALIAGDIAGDHHDLDLTYNTALDSAAGGWLLSNPEGDLSLVTPTEIWEYAISDETTAITTGTAKLTSRAGKALTVSDVRASFSTAGSTASQFDINLDGVSMLSTKLTVDANEKTSETAATPAVISDTTITDDQEITFDIDTAGTGAKGAKIRIIGTPT